MPRYCIYVTTTAVAVILFFGIQSNAEPKNDSSGGSYVGSMINGKRNGFGTLTKPNGATYEGSWTDDSLNGFIKYRNPNGESYDGEVRNNKLDGQGALHRKDGDSYVGEWRDGKMSGRGVYTSSDGSHFEGTWLEGLMNGFVLLTKRTPTGIDRMEGVYVFGKPYGNMKLIKADGSIIIGDEKFSKGTGHGYYYASSGDIYEISAENGKLNGLAIFTRASGERITSTMVNDIPVGRIVVDYPNGNSCYIIRGVGSAFTSSICIGPHNESLGKTDEIYSQASVLVKKSTEQAIARINRFQ